MQHESRGAAAWSALCEPLGSTAEARTSDKARDMGLWSGKRRHMGESQACRLHRPTALIPALRVYFCVPPMVAGGWLFFLPGIEPRLSPLLPQTQGRSLRAQEMSNLFPDYTAGSV